MSDDDPIVLHWIEMLKDFEQNIQLLEKLLSDAMTVCVGFVERKYKNKIILSFRQNNGDFCFVQMVMIMIHSLIIVFKI
jgi:hypothetical protein